MLLSQASAATVASILDSVSAANTAAATSGTGKWLDVRPYDGELLVIQVLGAITGTIAGKLQSASDANGTSAADIAGAVFATNLTNTSVSVVISPRQVPGGFLGYVGTVVTGPTIIGVTVAGKKKIV